jgi:Flp pilus assembly protein CpaB
MRSRGLVVVLALILATLAVVGLFLYTRSVKEDATSGGALTEVVVSKVDIAANTDLNQLINEGQFELKNVPTDDLVQGAIQQVSELRNRRNSVPILAGEQIPLSRVEGGKVTGGVLGIPDGLEAIVVALDAPRAVAGAMAGGDFVTIYATFTDVPLKEKKKNQTTTSTAAATAAQQQAQQGQDVTVVLVPQVQVLRVAVPQQASGVSGTVSTDTTGSITVALGLKPEDAQKFVFALEQGKVWLSLLPPNGEGVELKPLTVEGIIGGAKKVK